MTIKTMKKLTKAQLIHLIDSGVTTEQKLRKQMDATQKTLNEFHQTLDKGIFTGCWDCVAIGKRLGMSW